MFLEMSLMILDEISKFHNFTKKNIIFDMVLDIFYDLCRRSAITLKPLVQHELFLNVRSNFLTREMLHNTANYFQILRKGDMLGMFWR